MHPSQPAAQRQRVLAHVADTDVGGFFDRLTGPQLLGLVEALHHPTPAVPRSTPRSARTRAPDLGIQCREAEAQRCELVVVAVEISQGNTKRAG
jgi:hypothetical protein